MRTEYKKYIWMGIGIILLFIILLNNMFFTDSFSSYEIVFVPKEADDTTLFWQVLENGAKMAAQEYDIDFRAVKPASEEDVEGQIQILEDLIEEKPDAILLAVIDSEELVPVSKEIVAAGIRLVTVDSGLVEDVADCNVATDNVEGGYQMGKMVGNLAGKEDRILIVSHMMETESAINRVEGIYKGLEEFGLEKNIIEVYDCGISEENSYEYVKQKLKEDGDIDFIVGTNEYSTIGIGRAVEELKKQDELKVIGFDGTIPEVKFLEAGIITGLVVQENFAMGYSCVTAAVELLKAEEGVMLEKNIKTPPVVVTKENMYSEDNQKLLFPFLRE